jgi:hypothetical protein
MPVRSAMRLFSFFLLSAVSKQSFQDGLHSMHRETPGGSGGKAVIFKFQNDINGVFAQQSSRNS